ncbi:hypothetical protein ACHAP8_004679 [Fusarium lateritium]
MTSISGPSMADEEANSTLSNDDGSSGDESRMAGAGPSKKRRREKHQKISPGAGRNGFSIELEAKVNRIDALLQALGRRVEDHIVQDHSPVVSPAGQSTYSSDPPQTIILLSSKVTRYIEPMAGH